MRHLNFIRLLSLMVLTFLMLPLQSFAGGISEEYTIEGSGTGVEGSYLVKVTLVLKQASVRDEAFVRCAIHGVLFRGFENQQMRQHQRAMTGSEQEEEHADFYENFFKTDLSSYAEVVEGSRQVRMAGKKYRISSVVQVYKDKLRHDLEKKGIIKELTNGF